MAHGHDLETDRRGVVLAGAGGARVRLGSDQMMDPIMIPTIHLNGTSGDALLDQVVDAVGAIRTAIDACGQAAPNGRDYYPQGPDAITRATAEHNDRIARLRSVRSELELIGEEIADQLSRREARKRGAQA